MSQCGSNDPIVHCYPSSRLALSSHAFIRVHTLRSCSIGDEGAAAIFRGLAKNKSITDLNMQSVTLEYFGIQSLRHALSQNSTLTKLNLWGCGLGDARSGLLFPGLEANKGLKEVSSPDCCQIICPRRAAEDA